MTHTPNIDTAQTPQTPQKIPTTNRILLKGGRVIYVSSEITTQLTELKLITRVNQRHAPLKGMYDELINVLKHLSTSRPQHFAKSAIAIISTIH